MTEQIAPPKLDGNWMREGSEAAAGAKTVPPQFRPEQPQLPEFHSEDIAALEKIGSEALAQAEKQASDQRYVFKHKNEAITALLSNAANEVENASKKALERYTKRQAELEKLIRLSPIPSAEQIQRYQYAKDYWQNRVSTMPRADILTTWEDVILIDKDVESAKALQDITPPLFLAGRKHDIPLATEERQRLSDLTDDLRSTPEQRKARAELPKVQETITRLKISRSATLSKLRSTYLDSTGTKLLDKSSVARRALIRD
jgi:hypothetical protein